MLSLVRLATAAAAPSACRMILVRHGETNFNADGRLQGRLESELTPLGLEQASALGRWFATIDDSIDRVFVSPRKRTVQTLANLEEASQLALPAAQPRRGLREIELTMWEGQHRSHLRDAEGNDDSERWARWKARPSSFVFIEDGHAPLQDLKRRAREEWEALLLSATAGRTSLVVAHGAFNRVLMLTALGLPVDDFGFHDDRFAFENCAAVELQWTQGGVLATAWRKRYPSESEWVTREAEVQRRLREEHAALAGEAKQEL